MGYLIVWVLQLLVFFAIVSSVAVLFMKSAKATAKNPEARERSDEVEAPRQNAEKYRKRNNRQNYNQSEKKTGEQYLRQEISEPLINDVVTLSSLNKTKKQNTRITFNKQNLKKAIIYKEILDKPLALREDE